MDINRAKARRTFALSIILCDADLSKCYILIPLLFLHLL